MNNEFLNADVIPQNETRSETRVTSDRNLTYNALIEEMENRQTVRTAIEGPNLREGVDYLEHDTGAYMDTANGGIDLNVGNYSIDELYALVDVNKDEATPEMILETIYHIKQEFREHKLPQVVNFFDEIETVLVYDMANNVIPLRDGINTDQVDENEAEEASVGDRDEAVDVEDDDKNDENKEESAASNLDDTDENKLYSDRNETLLSFNSQNISNVNPLLRENVTRIISIDSFFRINSLPSLKNVPYSSIDNDHQSVYSTTNFTVTLSEPVTFVTKLTLESVYIPNTFYHIDDAYGNTSFAIRFLNDPEPNPFKIIKLENGNYNITNLIDDVIEQINSKFSKSLPPSSILYNIRNGKLEFLFDEPYEIVFYDNNYYEYLTADGFDIPPVLPKLNYNLGWVLGFRDPIYKIDTPDVNGNYILQGEAMADLRGPRYFIIVIDDFNHNHLNKTIVTSENRRNTPALPNYNTANLQVEVRDGVSNYQQIVDGENIDNYPITGQYPFFTRQDTANLTQSQLYTLNEISKERQKVSKLIIESPTENNVFGIIPNTLGHNNDFGDAIILTSNQIRDNTREYFGKVDIERLAVRLFDDKGHLMNLNGTNWALTLRALCSYNMNDNEDYIKYTHNLHY